MQIADFLLRRLRRLFPSAVLRAYADDLSAVLPLGLSELPRLVSVFEEYAAISGLRLNLPKTVLIPLYICRHNDLSQDLACRFPFWVGITVAGTAKYLGFFLRPDRGELGFQKASVKFAERARGWGHAGGGLFLTSLAYSVYIASVLMFLLQLDELPARWQGVEASAFRALVPGPGVWCLPVDLHHLDHFGLPRAILDVKPCRLWSNSEWPAAKIQPMEVSWYDVARASYASGCHLPRSMFVQASGLIGSAGHSI